MKWFTTMYAQLKAKKHSYFHMDGDSDAKVGR